MLILLTHNKRVAIAKKHFFNIASLSKNSSLKEFLSLSLSFSLQHHPSFFFFFFFFFLAFPSLLFLNSPSR